MPNWHGWFSKDPMVTDALICYHYYRLDTKALLWGHISPNVTILQWQSFLEEQGVSGLPSQNACLWSRGLIAQVMSVIQTPRLHQRSHQHQWNFHQRPQKSLHSLTIIFNSLLKNEKCDLPYRWWNTGTVLRFRFKCKK